MFGAVPRHNLYDLIYQGKNIKDIITWGPMEVGFISGGSGIAGMANLSRDYLNYIIKNRVELDALADVIIIDTGAGISDAVLEFLVASGEILLVTTPEPTSITDAYALLKALNRNSSYHKTKTVVKLIANQVRDKSDAKELHEKLGVVVNKFLNIDIDLLGAIPYDENMTKAILKQEPIVLSAPATQAAKSLIAIAAKLGGETSFETQGFGIMRLFSSVIRMKFGRKE